MVFINSRNCGNSLLAVGEVISTHDMTGAGKSLL